MFLCNAAKKAILKENPIARKRWDALVQQKKAYTWPDRLVIFDTLEQICMEAGYTSPLMFLNNSPGLLRVNRLGIQRKAKSDQVLLVEILSGDHHATQTCDKTKDQL